MDMYVDYDTLCLLEDKLEKINYDLNSSAEQMYKAIQRSQGFLAGNQFEKAKRTTIACVQLTETTGRNIKNAKEYIKTLKAVLEDYGKCCYSGEAS